jgi:hypothetical protein
VTVDTSEFAKLKVVKKEEDDLGLSVSSAKEKKGPKAKERKEVGWGEWLLAGRVAGMTW